MAQKSSSKKPAAYEFGRPTKINEERAEKIIRAIRAGNYIETAAALAGINKSTLYAWLKRGAAEMERLESDPKAKPKKSELPFLDFSNAVDMALAEAENRDIEAINAATKEDWRAAAGRLERKFPDRWGRKDRLQAEVENKGEVGLNLVISYGNEGEGQE